MSSPIDDVTIRILQRALGRFADGATVVAANLANVDTPGYRALRAQFPEQLERALGARTSHAGHIGAAGDGRRDLAALEEAPVTRIRPDGNTVDVDREMGELAAMRGRFEASTQMVRKRFALLRYAVSDGRSV